MRTTTTIGRVIVLAGILCVWGCGGDEKAEDPRRAEADRQVREKYGKPLDELPTDQLIVISPHNLDIEEEFENAFSLHHAIEYGRRVDIEWKDVGGGSTKILQYLRNIYGRAETSEIDVVWGGGEYNFQKMAAEDILQPMALAEDVRANIPARFGGLRMYDPNLHWCGSAVSGFGILYNAPLLKQLKLPPPSTWDDLAAPGYWNRVGLADPMQSGSAAAAYEMILQSGDSWQNGWAKLLGILGNAKKYYEGAGDAADAPVLGEAPVATCIDFYGATRVAKYPKVLVYVSPRGQTAFNPDPIAILKNPPNPQLAQRFVDFVLSKQGQALWAVRPGEMGGPIRAALGRQPIRKDVYTEYADRMSPWVINPYEAGQSLKLDADLWDLSYGVLRQLVSAAAVKNADALGRAKKTLIERGFPDQLVAEFNRLPENIDSIDDLATLNERLTDQQQAEVIVTEWVNFFKRKYDRISQ